MDLANIPFVRLRDELPEKIRSSNPLFDGRRGFSEAIALAEQAREPHILKLDLLNLRFQLDNQALEGLAAADLSFLCWLAWRQATGRGNLAMREILNNGKEIGTEYSRFCSYMRDRDDRLVLDARAAGQEASLRWMDLARVIEALETKGFQVRGDFEPRLSDLRTALTRTLGKRLADQFAPRNVVGRRGEASYGFIDFEDHFVVTPPSRSI